LIVHAVVHGAPLYRTRAYIGLFCGYIRGVCGYVGPSCGYIRDFCGYVGLFGGYLRDFCGYVGLFGGYVLHAHIYRALYRAAKEPYLLALFR